MAGVSFVGAVGFAASTGLATFFAPCAFPLLPGYVGYYLQESESAAGGIAAAGAAAVGALGALGAVAVVAILVGQPLKAALPILEPLVGVGLVVFGLAVFFRRGPELDVALPERTGSVTGFGVFGAVYALAAAGCVVPLFFGVLSQALTFSPVRGLTVLGVYALGVTVPLVGVTLLASAGVDAWKGIGKYTGHVQRVAAVILILAGLGQIYLSIVVLDVL